MKGKISVALVLGLTVWAGLVWAQQAKVLPAKDKPTAKAVATKDKPADKAAASGKIPDVPVVRVDGDAAYKANCARCHQAPRKFSERQMVTVMQHMRVRANLTEEETDAILKYLTR